MTDFELDDMLRSRFAALPTGPNATDWEDVRERAEAIRAPRRLHTAGAERRRRRLVRPRFALAFAVLALLIAAPATGLPQRLVQSLTQAEPAPESSVKSFEAFDATAPSGMETGVIAGQARIITRAAAFEGKQAALVVAPTRGGGYCTAVSGAGGDAGGCDAAPANRLSVGTVIPGPVRNGAISGPAYIYGSTTSPDAVSVQLVHADGDTTELQLVRVSTPINAGFFLYTVPLEQREHESAPTAVRTLDADGRQLAEEQLQFLPPSSLTGDG